MNIAITGAQGVGKTTLQSSLAHTLRHYDVLEPIPEFPRRRIAESGDSHFLDRANHAPTKQMLFFLDHLLEEDRLRVDDKVGLFDRFYLDYNAYINVLFPSKMSNLEMKALDAITLGKIRSYLVLYIPIEFPINDDGVIEIDPLFQREIDNYITATLRRSDAQFFVVSGTIDERNARASQVIRRKLDRRP